MNSSLVEYGDRVDSQIVYVATVLCFIGCSIIGVVKVCCCKSGSSQQVVVVQSPDFTRV